MKDETGRRVYPGGCVEACAAGGHPSSFILSPRGVVGGVGFVRYGGYRPLCPFDIDIWRCVTQVVSPQ